MLDGGTYPSLKLAHSVFGKINYGGLKHNSLFLGLVLTSGGGDRASLHFVSENDPIKGIITLVIGQ